MRKKLIWAVVSTTVLLSACGGSSNSSEEEPVIPIPTPTPTPIPEPTPEPTPISEVSHVISGELMQWHKVTLTLTGLMSSETADINPFTDYNFEVVFSQSSESVTVPGYFAACEDAQESGCNEGEHWRAHFTPNMTGTWDYNVRFTTGSDVAILGGGAVVTELDGLSGSFEVTISDKAGRDFRATNNGRLSYTQQHYLTYSDGRPFFKLGASSPENTLAYEDFDATPNRGSLIKSWAPHTDDYDNVSARPYTWQTGNGSELLGAWAYLANSGVNAVALLTFSLGGEDGNVFPHLLKVNETEYEALDDIADTLWGSVHADRFDVSKLAQWEQVFSYADQLGVLLHFKTMERNNDQLMDGGMVLGRERQIYYRELVARFGHHLGVQWNIGKNYSLDTSVAVETLDYLKNIDPYNSLRVMHTLQDEKNVRLEPLRGLASELTGASLHTNQGSFFDVRWPLLEWLNNSKSDGTPWVISLDEQGTDQRGIGVDADYTGVLPSVNTQAGDRTPIRSHVLWNALTTGSAGTEYYYGSSTGCTNLNCEDHRTRSNKWLDGSSAVTFFNNYLGQDALTMTASNDVTVAYPNANVYLPNADGIYAIEIEDAFGENPPAPWVFDDTQVVTPPGKDFSGTGYYRSTSLANSLGIIDAGEGLLTYIIDVPTGQASDYRMTAGLGRPVDPSGRGDTFNDLWFRIIELNTGEVIQPIPHDNLPERTQPWWKLFFGQDPETWQFPWNLDANNGKKYRPHYNLEEGRYAIQFAVRSNKVRLDRVTIRKGIDPYRDIEITTLAADTVQVATPNNDYVLAERGEKYVIYLPWVEAPHLDLSDVTGSFSVQWYDPKTAGVLVAGSVTSVMGGEVVSLGSPPSQAGSDWIILVSKQ